MEKPPIKKKEKNLPSLVYVILLIVGVGWLCSQIEVWSNSGSERDPFWSGTEQIQVCPTPYYSSSGCYILNVYIEEPYEEAIIYLDNENYIYVSDVRCYDAAQLNDTPKYVFCRSWDSEGQQWDFLPVWLQY